MLLPRFHSKVNLGISAVRPVRNPQHPLLCADLQQAAQPPKPRHTCYLPALLCINCCLLPSATLKHSTTPENDRDFQRQAFDESPQITQDVGDLAAEHARVQAFRQHPSLPPVTTRPAACPVAGYLCACVVLANKASISYFSSM